MDAPASQRLRRTRKAWKTASPRGPWERVQDPPRWFSARSVRDFLFMRNLGVSCIIHDSEEFPSPQPCAVTERTHTAVSPHAARSMLWISASAPSGEWPRMVDHWSLGVSLVLWPTAVRRGAQLFDQPGVVRARAKVEGRLRSRVSGAPASRGLVTHVAHVQAASLRRLTNEVFLGLPSPA